MKAIKHLPFFPKPALFLGNFGSLFLFSAHIRISSSFLMVRHNIDKQLIIFLRYSCNITSRRFRLTFHSNQHILVPYSKHNFQNYQPSKIQQTKKFRKFQLRKLWYSERTADSTFSLQKFVRWQIHLYTRV